MNRPELYKKTVDILYQAYFNDTLQHGNCYACAVGNIVAANCGYSFKTSLDAMQFQNLYWAHESESIYDCSIQASNQEMWYDAIGGGSVIRSGFNATAIKQIDATGYTPKELCKVEVAFERAARGNNNEQHMFNGLEAVLEALKLIHAITDDDNINNDRFREHYKTRMAVAK
jgi:hypothetical protein